MRANVLVLAFERERRRTRYDLESRNSSERVDDLLGQAVAEVLVLLVAAHVLERQYGDRLRALYVVRGERLERRAQLGDALVAPSRVLLQAAAHDELDCGRTFERRGLALQHRAEDLASGVALECTPASDKLVKQRTEAEDIATRVDRPALRLLGGHVRRGAEYRAGLRHRYVAARRVELRDAEIEQLRDALGGDDNVRRLEIAVQDPVCVRCLQSAGDLQCNPSRVLFRLRTMQVGSLDELEYEVVGPDVVNLTNVRVI